MKNEKNHVWFEVKNVDSRNQSALKYLNKYSIGRTREVPSKHKIYHVLPDSFSGTEYVLYVLYVK